MIHRPGHRRCVASEAHLDTRQTHAQRSGLRSVAQSAASTRERILPEAHARAKDYCEQAIAPDPEICRSACAVGFQLSLYDHAHGQAHTGGRTLDSPGARRALELGALRNRPAFPGWCGCGRPRLRLAGRPLASFSWPWPVVRAAEAHWATPACTLSTFARFEESTAQMRRSWTRPAGVLWRGTLMALLVCGREVRRRRFRAR